jgi:hypothetical protein
MDGATQYMRLRANNISVLAIVAAGFLQMLFEFPERICSSVFLQRKANSDGISAVQPT